jgi:hypothetical protein
VFFYGPSVKIPPDEAAVIGIVDDDGNAASAGYHAALGTLPFGLVDMSQSREPSCVLSHEVLELILNPYLDRKMPGPDGLLYLGEACDAVQALRYEVEVELFGVRRKEWVSDFLTPAWFATDGARPFNHLDTLVGPFQIGPGGYALAEDAQGHMVMLTAPEGARLTAAKLNLTSRTSRLVRA